MGGPPARAGLEEAIGVNASRTRVKRRKAWVEGELAPGSEAQFLLVSAWSNGDGMRSMSVILTPRDLLGSSLLVGRKTKG